MPNIPTLLLFLSLFVLKGIVMAQSCTPPQKPLLHGEQDTVYTDCEGKFRLHVSMGAAPGVGFLIYQDSSADRALKVEGNVYHYEATLATSIDFALFSVIAYGSDTNCLSPALKVVVRRKKIPELELLNVPTQVCNSAAPFTLNASPSGGVFEGPGVVNGAFYPELVSSGKYVLEYSGNFWECPYRFYFTMEVQASPAFELFTENGPFPDTLCKNSVLTMQAIPAGGVFSGQGVNAEYNTFSAPLAGVGTWEITYQGQFQACPYTFHKQITVTTLRSAKIIPAIGGTPANVCFGGAPFRLIATPEGGELEGNAIIGDIFFPANAGIGKHLIRYTYQDSLEGCAYNGSLEVNVHDGSGPVGIKIAEAWGCNATIVWDNLGEEVYKITLQRIGQTTLQSYQVWENYLELSNIEAMQEYSVCLYAGCYRSCTTLIFPCPPPTGLRIHSVAATSVTYDWQTQPCARYVVQYRAWGEDSWQTARTSRPAMLTGLIPSTIYEIRLGSICSNQFPLVYSRSQLFTTAPMEEPKCLPPSFIEALEISATRAEVHWQPSGEQAPSCFKIRYGELTTPPPLWIEKIVTGYTPQAVLEGLRPGLIYGVQVQSYCSGCGNNEPLVSELSGIEYFQTLPARLDKSNAKEAISLEISPNPVRGQTITFKLELPEAAEITLQLLDVNGKIIQYSRFQVEANEPYHSWKIDALPQGVYWLRVTSLETNLAQKIIIIQ
jgi:hypothetical protein